MNIPPNAVIKGIGAVVHRKASASDGVNYVVDASVNLIKANGTLSASSFAATGVPWGVVPTELEYGSSISLWGETWTPDDLNSGEFGVAIAATQAGTAIAAIDFVGVQIYYTI